MNIEEKASAAKRLRKDEGFQAFIAEVREAAIADFVNSGPKETEAREEAHAILRALAAIEARLSAAEGAKALKDRKGQHRVND